MENKNLLIAIVGPTASGKSELAVKLARKLNGEIISADSRQIYRGLNIGSGKVEGQWKKISKKEKSDHKVFVYKNIPHYLIDEASPLRQYSVAKFKTAAEKIIADIFSRGKQPIICGGTAHWVDAVAFNKILPEVKPDKKLRAKLSKLTTSESYKLLQKLDPKRAKNIDPKNPRRLMRALEIVMVTGKPVPEVKSEPKYKVKWMGINPNQETLDKKIKKRLKQRLKDGMLEEVQKLHKQGLSWKRLESFGLEYKFCALYLQKKLQPENTIKQLESQLFTAIRQYAKRQKTWWKRNSEIDWN